MPELRHYNASNEGENRSVQANVLIVEDVREMAELIAVYLQREGVATKIAESGELAFQIVQA